MGVSMKCDTAAIFSEHTFPSFMFSSETRRVMYPAKFTTAQVYGMGVSMKCDTAAIYNEHTFASFMFSSETKRDTHPAKLLQRRFTGRRE